MIFVYLYFINLDYIVMTNKKLFLQSRIFIKVDSKGGHVVKMISETKDTVDYKYTYLSPRRFMNKFKSGKLSFYNLLEEEFLSHLSFTHTIDKRKINQKINNYIPVNNKENKRKYVLNYKTQVMNMYDFTYSKFGSSLIEYANTNKYYAMYGVHNRTYVLSDEVMQDSIGHFNKLQVNSKELKEILSSPYIHFSSSNIRFYDIVKITKSKNDNLGYKHISGYINILQSLKDLTISNMSFTQMLNKHILSSIESNSYSIKSLTQHFVKLYNDKIDWKVFNVNNFKLDNILNDL